MNPQLKAVLNSQQVDFVQFYEIGIYCYYFFALVSGVVLLINSFKPNLTGFIVGFGAELIIMHLIWLLHQKREELKRRINGK